MSRLGLQILTAAAAALLIVAPGAEALGSEPPVQSMQQQKKKQTGKKKSTSKQGKSQPRRSIDSVKREQEAARKRVKLTSQQIQDNEADTRRQLARLNELRRSRDEQQSVADAMKLRLDSANRAIRRVSDSIADCEARIGRLRDSYVTSLRRMQAERSSMSKLTFVFSAESFTQAYRRMRYLNQFGEWERLKKKELREAGELLQERRNSLQSLKEMRARSLSELNAATARISEQQQQTTEIVDNLNRKGSQLREVLRDQQKQERDLATELDKLIAAEQARIERERREKAAREKAERERREKAERERRAAEERRRLEAERAAAAARAAAEKAAGEGKPAPATPKPAERPAPKPVAVPPAGKPAPKPAETTEAIDRRLTGSFADNKGRLIYPVSGRHRVVRGYGRQAHPDLPHVTTDNSGIDIEGASGSQARAVFEGEVVSVLSLPGSNYVVIVRHGDYYTVYANIGAPAVRTGAMIKAGQSLGRLMPSDINNGDASHPVLHFEVRHKTTKLNPSQWISSN